MIVFLFTIVLCFGEKALDLGDGLCLAIPIGITALSWLSHFIALMIMRWRHVGKVCSGDYLEGEYSGYRWNPFGEDLKVPDG